MVSKKLKYEKEHQTFRKTKKNKSTTKLTSSPGKQEDKMIENLRGIQETLKNKLEKIQKEDAKT